MKTENTLNSLHKLRKVEPSPFLYDKILAKISLRKQQLVPAKWAYLSIAIVVGLLIFNFTISSFRFNSKTNQTIEIFSGSDKAFISYE